MAQIPFTIAVKETTTNGGTLSFFYKAPNGQDIKINQFMFVIGAAFNLTRIQDDRGQYYSQASTTDPIPSTELPQSNTDVHLLNLPSIPLILKGGTTLEVEIVDTGGGGAVTLLINGEMTIPN